MLSVLYLSPHLNRICSEGRWYLFCLGICELRKIKWLTWCHHWQVVLLGFEPGCGIFQSLGSQLLSHAEWLGPWGGNMAGDTGKQNKFGGRYRFHSNMANFRKFTQCLVKTLLCVGSFAGGE